MKVCCFFGNGNSRPNSGSILLMHCYYWRIALLKFFGTISWFGSVFLAQFLDDHRKHCCISMLNCSNSWELSFAALWCNVWNVFNMNLCHTAHSHILKICKKSVQKLQTLFHWKVLLHTFDINFSYQTTIRKYWIWSI